MADRRRRRQPHAFGLDPSGRPRRPWDLPVTASIGRCWNVRRLAARSDGGRRVLARPVSSKLLQEIRSTTRTGRALEPVALDAARSTTRMRHDRHGDRQGRARRAPSDAARARRRRQIPKPAPHPRCGRRHEQQRVAPFVRARYSGGTRPRPSMPASPGASRARASGSSAAARRSRPWETPLAAAVGNIRQRGSPLNLRLAELLPSCRCRPGCSRRDASPRSTGRHRESRDADDRRGIVESCSVAGRSVEQYLALLTTDGPLVPIEATGGGSLAGRAR